MQKKKENKKRQIAQRDTLTVARIQPGPDAFHRAKCKKEPPNTDGMEYAIISVGATNAVTQSVDGQPLLYRRVVF